MADLLWRLFLSASRSRHTRSLCDWSSDVCSSDLAVRPDYFIPRAGDGVGQFLDADGRRVEQHRSLAAGEIDLDLLDTGLGGKRLVDCLLTLMAVHALDLDQEQLIISNVLSHVLLRTAAAARPAATRRGRLPCSALFALSHGAGKAPS